MNQENEMESDTPRRVRLGWENSQHDPRRCVAYNLFFTSQHKIQSKVNFSESKLAIPVFEASSSELVAVPGDRFKLTSNIFSNGVVCVDVDHHLIQTRWKHALDTFRRVVVDD